MTARALRLCPVHGLPLRPYRRVGKVECPDSACMYVEPHVCEEKDLTCDCPEHATARFTPRILPACPGCFVVQPGSRVIEQTHGRIQAGDAQCTGKCFDRAAWNAWVAGLLGLAMLLLGCGGDPFSAALVDAPAADAAPVLLAPTTLDAGAAGDVDPPSADDARAPSEASRSDTALPAPDAGDDARPVHLVDAGVDVAELLDVAAADAGDAAAGDTSTPLPESAPPPPPALCCFTPCGGLQVSAITCGNGPDWTCDNAGGASCSSVRCSEQSSCHWQGTTCVGTVKPCS